MAPAKTKTNPAFSLASGTIAGAVEGFATYPIEYTKTVAQFSTRAGERVRNASKRATDKQPPNPLVIARDTVANHGIRGLYSGCGALVAGNALKVRRRQVAPNPGGRAFPLLRQVQGHAQRRPGQADWSA
jgi:hypothetical protein